MSLSREAQSPQRPSRYLTLSLSKDELVITGRALADASFDKLRTRWMELVLQQAQDEAGWNWSANRLRTRWMNWSFDRLRTRLLVRSGGRALFDSGRERNLHAAASPCPRFRRSRPALLLPSS